MSQQNPKVSELSRSLRTTGTSGVTINPTSSAASILGSITAATSTAQAQGSASSRPMNIARLSTRGSATPNKDGPALAQSAPLMFRQPPPKAPPARPRLPSIDPPPMTLPPSPPVSVPVQLTAGGGPEKEENPSSGLPVAAAKKGYEPSSRNTSTNANNAVYSRSLSDYNYMMLSASCPPTNEFMSRMGNKFVAVTEEKLAGKDDDEETDVSDLPEVGGRLARKHSEDNSSNSQAHTADSSALLSKSPTIFSLLNNKPDMPSALSQSLNTRPSSNSAIFGSLGAIRNLHPNAPSNAPAVSSPTSASSHPHPLPHSAGSIRGPSSHSTTQSASAHLHAAATSHPHGDDDVNGLSDGLQFSMSLTDEQSLLDDDDQEDTTNSNATTNTNASTEDNVFLPLY